MKSNVAFISTILRYENRFSCSVVMSKRVLDKMLYRVFRELIPKSRDPGHFSNPEIPGLSSPNPGIFGIKLCRISALFSPHLAALANPFDC